MRCCLSPGGVFIKQIANNGRKGTLTNANQWLHGAVLNCERRSSRCLKKDNKLRHCCRDHRALIQLPEMMMVNRIVSRYVWPFATIIWWLYCSNFSLQSQQDRDHGTIEPREEKQEPAQTTTAVSIRSNKAKEEVHNVQCGCACISTLLCVFIVNTHIYAHTHNIYIYIYIYECVSERELSYFHMLSNSNNISVSFVIRRMVIPNLMISSPSPTLMPKRRRSKTLMMLPPHI